MPKAATEARPRAAPRLGRSQFTIPHANEGLGCSGFGFRAPAARLRQALPPSLAPGGAPPAARLSALAHAPPMTPDAPRLPPGRLARGRRSMGPAGTMGSHTPGAAPALGGCGPCTRPSAGIGPAPPRPWAARAAAGRGGRPVPPRALLTTSTALPGRPPRSARPLLADQQASCGRAARREEPRIPRAGGRGCDGTRLRMMAAIERRLASRCSGAFREVGGGC